MSTPAQEAALASLGDPGEWRRRRELNASACKELEGGCAPQGSSGAWAGRPTLVLVELGEDSRLSRSGSRVRGAIVRPTHGFGAPEAIRVSGDSGGAEFLAEPSLA